MARLFYYLVKNYGRKKTMTFLKKVSDGIYNLMVNSVLNSF